MVLPGNAEPPFRGGNYSPCQQGTSCLDLFVKFPRQSRSSIWRISLHGSAPYSWQKATNSQTSTLRSPDSHFEMNDCGRPRRSPTWLCVKPAFRRACFRRLRNRAYAGEKTILAGCFFIRGMLLCGLGISQIGILERELAGREGPVRRNLNTGRDLRGTPALVAVLLLDRRRYRALHSCIID